MNGVDSSGWLEYFAGGVNAPVFSEAIENTPEIIVPALSLYEVPNRTACTAFAAAFWTQEPHFEKITGVNYKKARRQF